ncbi:MAG TPA: acyltransferase [Epsilonproteobacteria bacterium]|nr:acyltransferase [Campylobacterota bacterium]
MNSFPRKNNFDHIRLFLALGVFLFHVGELTGIEDFHLLTNGTISAAVAVHSFFIVSGFLIFMSYDRSSSLKHYLMKRLRRIAPGYIAVILLSFLFLSLLSTLPLQDYFFSHESAGFLFANLTTLNFLHPTLPGVFETHRYTAVNGALWTIKVEVAFYLAIPLIAYFYRWIKPEKILAVIFVFSALYYFAMGYLYEQGHDPLFAILQRQLPAQMMFFSGGALLYYMLERFRRHSTALLLVAISVYILQNLVNTDLLYPLYALSLSVIVIYLAVIFPYLGHIARYGDLSYGIYIWHFPTVQTFISLHLFDTHPMLALLGLTSIVLLLAWLSWHLIEKPFLGKRSHYIKENEESK